MVRAVLRLILFFNVGSPKESIFLVYISVINTQTLQITLFNFIESTLHDVFVYKAGVFTYFFRTLKVMLSQDDVITKFSDSMILKFNSFI